MIADAERTETLEPVRARSMPGAPPPPGPKARPPRWRLIIAGRDWTRLGVLVAVVAYCTAAVTLGILYPREPCPPPWHRETCAPAENLLYGASGAALIYAAIPLWTLAPVAAAAYAVLAVRAVARWFAPRGIDAGEQTDSHEAGHGGHRR